MKKLVELKERLVAIGEFANEAVALIDSMGDVAPAEKAPAKADKKAPAVEKEVVDPLAEVIAEYDLEEKSIAELKELLADTDIPYNKKGKKASEFINLVAQGILDGKIGSEEEESEETDEESEEISEEDIQAMKLPELIEFAKENEIEIPKAIAKSVAKVRELVLDWLVENSAEAEEEEEEIDEPTMSEEEVKALTEELMEKDLSELKEILELAEINIPAKAKKPALITLIIAGIIDGSIVIAEEEESDEEDGEGYTEEDINALNLKELIALAKEAELEYTAKDAKSADKMKELLISALCDDSGDDEDASEEEEGEELTQEDVEAMGIKELTALALENDVDIPKAIAKKVDKIRELLIETFFADEEEEDAVEEASEAVLEAEEKVRKDVASQIKSKKLTTKKIKEFLKQYYEGDPDCKDCKGCSEDEMIECYTNIQVSLVDDDGDIMEMGDGYTRNGEDYCCGKTLEDVDGVQTCTICGTQYE